ncbi:MAG TPA: single-stranded DNA-binding protein [Nocardioides sp.]
MSPRKETAAPVAEPESMHSNEVVLVGRLAQEAQLRELPSGDVLCTFRLVVDRSGAARSRQTVDAVECVVWSARLRRTVTTWRPGDVVRVEGALRRRFFRSSGSVASRVEVEAVRARVVRRAASA